MSPEQDIQPSNIAHPPLSPDLGTPGFKAEVAYHCVGFLEEMNRRFFMEKILEAWIRLPDMRLGQLMMSAGLRNGSDDLFYLEDQQLVLQVQALAAQLKG